MRTFGVVERKVPRESTKVVARRRVVVQIDLLVLYAAPNKFGEDVAQRTITSVETDFDAQRFRTIGVKRAREGTTLIAVPD